MANLIRKNLDKHASIGKSKIEAEVANLNAIYSASRDRLESLLTKYVRSGRNSFTGPKLVLLLEALKGEYKTLEDDYCESFGSSLNWVAEGYYRDAMLALAVNGGNNSISGGISKERITLMQEDSFAHIAGATKNMSDYSISQLRNISARVMRESALTGESRVQIAKRLYNENGGDLFSFIDRSNKKWDNKSYFDMLSRTMLHNNAREAYLQGCADEESDIVTISVSGAPCPKCAKYENRLFSISGKTKNLPLLQDAINDGLFHPNCTHRIIAVPEVLAKNNYEENGQPLDGVNAKGNEQKDTPEAWKEYRQEQQTRQPARTPSTKIKSFNPAKNKAEAIDDFYKKHPVD